MDIRYRILVVSVSLIAKIKQVMKEQGWWYIDVRMKPMSKNKSVLLH
ncbi:MAG: hypothetical protein OXC67_07145 [Flavobacteriaceae bacterium]|nr:hypothetical protein [Flavobacteriaceae bacterium]